MKLFHARSFFALFVCFTSGYAMGQYQNHSGTFANADSLFMDKNYRAAETIYKRLLPDSSRDAFHLNRLGYTELLAGRLKESRIYFSRALASDPAPPVKASILSRLAMVEAMENHADRALVFLDSAIHSGYISIPEMDSSASFASLRKSAGFKALRENLFNSIYPCFNNRRAREFDFWLGEWNVFVTGTDVYAGHSLIQKISGGCAILENWNSAISEGKSLNFIDDSSSKWKQVWIGSYPNGKQDFVNGEYTDSAMRFSFTTRDAQGNTVQGRFIFFNEGPAQVRQLNETSADGGKTWTTNYDFTYKRKI